MQKSNLPRRTKQQYTKYGWLPENNQMIKPGKLGWFESKETTTRSSNVVSNIVEQTWLMRYLWSQKAILDRGTEFMKDFITLVQENYGIKCKPITTRNSKANFKVERAHQTIGNILCTFEQDSAKLDPEDSWGGILSAER
eukprot:189473-Ditylum_brightwellii.AAC.1